MIIINKKRVYTIFTLLLISVVCFEFQSAGITDIKIVETVALPVNERTIIIDAGHGSPDEGASTDDNVTEAGINLKISLKLKKLLEDAGSHVILTRSDEQGIYDVDAKTIREKKVSDLKNRVKIGNESGADILVSIHLNKIPQEKYWGWQTFFKEGNENSKKLAESIQEGLNSSIQKENKRVSLKINNIYLMEHVEIPMTIVECGFLSNKEEKNLLQTEEYQDKLAWGIYIGIMNYFLE